MCLSTLELSAPALAQEFSVRRTNDDSVVLTGELSDEIAEEASRVPVRIADFSEVDEPGSYYVEVEGIGRSVSFRVAEDVYDGELKNVMLAFYHWRSGIDIAFEHGGHSYQHAAGHVAESPLDYIGLEGETKDGSGGWYDAGDYGRYMPTASLSAATMLSAWERYSDKLEKIELPFIPEHGSALPDYLSEIKWELDWIMKMAYDDGSGRVHHKLSSRGFATWVLPGGDDRVVYFSPFSTAATAELVATLAKAARSFEPYDVETDDYSELLLAAAWRSYQYLQEDPEDVDQISDLSGIYPTSGIDDRLWAAAELWETTGDDAVLADFESRIGNNTEVVANFDWDVTTNMGLLTYLSSQREGRDPEIVEQLETSLFEVVSSILRRQQNSAYGRGFNLYYWGTNAVLVRMCMVLDVANQLEPNPEYAEACAEQLGYLYGRNQYNRSQVTGSGIEPPSYPHHRPSAADEVEAPYPGLLVGGGQSATNWRDSQNDAATNEVAINWNSALAYALASLSSGAASDSLGVGPIAAEDCGVRVSSIGYQPGRSKRASVQSTCALPSNFECKFGAATQSGDVSGPLSMIDNFEDEDLSIIEQHGREGTWSVNDDGSGTRSEPKIESAGRKGSKSALCIRGQDFAGWGGNLGVALASSGVRRPFDANEHTGITFWARGSETEFSLLLPDKYSDPSANECAACYDHFRKYFHVSDEWQQYTFSWSEFEQLGFGDEQPSLCPAELRALQFQWPVDTDFELCVDDIAFTSPAGGETLVATGGGGCVCQLGVPPRGSLPLALLGLLGVGLRRRRHRTC